MNPDWFSPYVLETVWDPSKDTSGKMAGAYKKKKYVETTLKDALVREYMTLTGKVWGRKFIVQPAIGKPPHLEGKRENTFQKMCVNY